MNIHDHNVTAKIFIHQNYKINDRQKSKKGDNQFELPKTLPRNKQAYLKFFECEITGGVSQKL